MYARQVSSGVHSVALDMMTVLVRKCTVPNRDTLMMHITFPAVVNRILHTDDLSTQQNGGECLRAFISVAAQEVSKRLATRDEFLKIIIIKRGHQCKAERE